MLAIIFQPPKIPKSNFKPKKREGEKAGTRGKKERREGSIFMLEIA